MDEIILEENQEKFIEIFNKYITRDGAGNLLDWLINSDFFIAPASSKFHSAHEGGLCEHSLKVFDRYVRLLQMEYGDDFSNKISMESVAIIALLHDVCKVDFYKTEYRNVKIDGQWVQVPYYTIEDQLPYGHGEKSVYIVGSFIKLTREEAMAINWHAGGFDDRVRGGSYGMAEAYYKFPNAMIFHTADMMATYLDETK
ncbi:MAG: hydrolase [Clostridia bacterium]|nr:hydrolase [Clostridia bacterium]